MKSPPPPTHSSLINGYVCVCVCVYLVKVFVLIGDILLSHFVYLTCSANDYKSTLKSGCYLHNMNPVKLPSKNASDMSFTLFYHL